MVDHPDPNDRRQRYRGVAAVFEVVSKRPIRRDRAKGLEDVVVHDERDRHVERERAADRGHEERADLLEIQRAREGR